jgi:DNA-binding GntR family transcriptional regulator
MTFVEIGSPATAETRLAGTAGLGPIVESQLLRQKIVTALHNAIEDGTLKAGDRLIERDLCNRLNVSRTSLREALRDLEANGIVIKANARELVVARLGKEDAVNLFRLRCGIELIVAEQFIQLGNPAALRDCRAANEAILAAAPGPDRQTAQRAFYRLFCLGAGNPFALEMLMNILLRLSVIRSASMMDQNSVLYNVDDRRKMLGAIERGDLEGASRAIRSHTESVIQNTIF